jgi:transcriptional regulator with XRE-family HTH domain
VLKLARQSAGLSQERLAEALDVDSTTVQAWESGRRPLGCMSASDFVALSGRLAGLGAPASTGRHLREALEADAVLTAAIKTGSSLIRMDVHPLATWVHRWRITNLIMWPLIGQKPPHLDVFRAGVPRRGPAPAQPMLHADERRRFFDHLLAIAERGSVASGSLLHRQAVYLLGFDGRGQVADWLRDEWRRVSRRLTSNDDVAEILQVRSAAVALASTGDGTYLADFVDHTTDARANLANLNYWAYWTGEMDDDQTNDGFMLEHDRRSWEGVRLLRHLTSRLDSESHHLPLNLHTLHSLIASRPTLLTTQSVARCRLAEAVEKLASTDVLNRTGRHQVAGLQYALRIAERQGG